MPLLLSLHPDGTVDSPFFASVLTSDFTKDLMTCEVMAAASEDVLVAKGSARAPTVPDTTALIVALVSEPLTALAPAISPETVQHCPRCLQIMPAKQLTYAASDSSAVLCYRANEPWQNRNRTGKNNYYDITFGEVGEIGLKQ